MSFFGDLFGGKSAQRQANQAADRQRSEMAAGYGRARDATNEGFTGADTILQGYEQPGREAFGLYADSIGLNGDAGYQNALSRFNADPFRQGYQDAASRAVRDTFRQYNARGMANSGAAGAAVSRTAADLYRGDVADFRNRLMTMGNQGAQFGTARAGNMIDRGNRLADFSIGEATGNANIEAARAANISAAKSQGMNNLMSGLGFLGGMALQGFAPGKGGVSSFGNMRNALMGGGIQ